MNYLEVWDHPELFKDCDFSYLDNKIKYIQQCRRTDPYYDKVLKELNKRIDIDYIKASEMIEGLSADSLDKLDFDSDYEELYETNIFDKRSRGTSIDEFYLGKYRTIYKNDKIYIYRKDPETGVITKFSCIMPDHLIVLNNTLEKARNERVQIRNGIKVPVTKELIEKIHADMFESHIYFNTFLSRDTREPITPEGYGKFRRTVNYKGKDYKCDVEVEGVNWTPTCSDDVAKEMNILLEKYNNSNFHPILKAMIFKACFVKIHPFRDGNGRTSRLLFNYMLVRNGIPTVTIKGIHKDEYFDAMNTAIEDNNYKPLAKMIKGELNQRCEQYIKVKERLDQERGLNNPSL